MAKDKEKEDQSEEELTVVTDDPKNLDEEGQVANDGEIPSKKVEADEDEKPRKGKKKAAPKEEEEDDGDGDDDVRLGASEETEAEEEESKVSKGKSRRQRRREAENRLRTELKFLEGRNDKLERLIQTLAQRLDNSERTTIEGRINYAKAMIKKAEGVISDATTEGKGEVAMEATKVRDNLRDQLKTLEDQKTKRDESDEDEQEVPDIRVVENVKSFMKRHSWFDYKRGDTDSKIAGALDDAMVAEGFDPATPEYWKELDKRLAKHLPHRVKRKNGRDPDPDLDDDDEDEEEIEERQERRSAKGKEAKRPSGGGPRFRTGGPGRDLKPNEVYLSRERIEALKEAGVWDDPALRAKYLKKYRDWDRENGVVSE